MVLACDLCYDGSPSYCVYNCIMVENSVLVLTHVLVFSCVMVLANVMILTCVMVLSLEKWEHVSHGLSVRQGLKDNVKQLENP